MSWLDANDSYFMEIMARDRIDELRSSRDGASAEAPGAEKRVADESFGPTVRLDRARASADVCPRLAATARCR